MSLIQRMAFLGSRYVDVLESDGQSNALGIGYTSALSSAPLNTLTFPLLSAFSKVLIYFPDTNQCEPLHIPVNNQAGNDPNAIYAGPTTAPAYGPEAGFAMAHAITFPDRYLIIMKNSANGQAIATFAPGGAHDLLRQSRRAAILAWLAAHNMVVGKTTGLWTQGEGDMFNNTVGYYSGQLNPIITNKYTDGTYKASDTVLIGQILPSSSNYSSTIASEKDDVVAVDPTHRKILPYIGSYNDGIHMDAYGQLRYGANAFALSYGTTPIALPGD